MGKYKLRYLTNEPRLGTIYPIIKKTVKIKQSEKSRNGLLNALKSFLPEKTSSKIKN